MKNLLSFITIISFLATFNPVNMTIAQLSGSSQEMQHSDENQESQTGDSLKTDLVHPWLQNRVTFAEIDSIYGNSPSENFRREYHEFKAQFQEGDELWYFCSPPESWGKKCLAGRAGYMLIRKGEVVASIVTLMN
jgi:hypothetical protein